MTTLNQTTIEPHDGPQSFALDQPDNIFEIAYGGARGGGKTFAGILWLLDHIDNPKFRALVIRKNADDLSDWIDRAGQIYRGFGATVAYRPAVITFPSGAIIKTGHLKDEQAYTKYQGHEYQRIVIEEATQIPDAKRYLQLIASCRSTVDTKPQIFLTANPGGVGHRWFKKRFIHDPLKVREVDGRYRIFIPATIDDNPTLKGADPDYVKTLDSLKNTDEQLWKAWRHGDWDVFVGQFFGEWRKDLHVSDRLEFPIDICQVYIGFDWGYNAPGSAVWLAYMPENQYGVSRVHIYRQIYQNGKTPEQWAKDIKFYYDLEKKVTRGFILPHDCFNTGYNKKSIADIFREIIKIPIIRANTLGKGSRINRAAITHQYLSISPDGKPYMLVHPTCTDLIENLPALVHDDKNVEDVDTDGADHDYDALSIALMSLYTGIGKGGIVKHRTTTSKRSALVPQKDGSYRSPDLLKVLSENSLKKKSNVEYGEDVI